MVKLKLKSWVWLVIALFVKYKGATAKEFPPYNGWFNNRGNPAAGTPDSVVTRRLPAHYADGVFAPSGPNRPNPRTVSTAIMSGSEGLPSRNNKTALFVFFGSHVMHEISDVEYDGCPPEHFNIPVPAGDPVFDPALSIPYQRSRYNQKDSGYSPNSPRNQLNAATSYIDGSSIYGTNRAWSDKLRLLMATCEGRTATSNLFASQNNPTDCRGELASLDDAGHFPLLNSIGLPLFNPVTPRDHQLKTANRFYRIGSRLAHENPFHLSLSIMWFRHHNYLARNIRDQNSGWNDQQVFEEARVQNIATYQNILMYEWLPKLLGNCSSSLGAAAAVPNYTGYKPGTGVGVSDIFQGAAMHYLATLAPPGVYRRNKLSSGCVFRRTTSATGAAGQPALRTCNTYWNSKEALAETDIDEILMGMASQIAEREDHVISSDLRNFFYGSIEFSRKDFVAKVLQRGRDHGLPDYNSARWELGLSTKTTFSAISPSVGANLSAISDGRVENVDIFTGGLLEGNSADPGELFCSVIRDQFLRLRDGDRFWFENTKQGHVTDVAAIRATKIRDVILRTNPSMNGSVDIQDYPFAWDRTVDGKLFCPQPSQLTESVMEPCSPLQRFDNFESSQAPYAVTFAVIGLFTILTILLMYWLGGMKRKAFQRHKEKVVMRRASVHAQRGDKMYIANELLGEKATQQIRIFFGPGPALITKLASSGKKVRKIELKHNMRVVRSITGERKIAYIRGPDENYDLVLSFADEEDREVFLRKFSNYMGSLSLSLDSENVSEAMLMAHAKTKHHRDAVLQTFFRTALAQVLKIDADDTNYTPDAEASKMLHVALSKEEFAEYLKLKPESLFVEQMFQVADVNDDGEVSFREFLDIMVLFTKGSARDKAKLLFNMYDLNRSGSLSADEFKVMLKSMMEMSDTTADSQHIDELVNQMMNKYGTKEELTLDDFQFMMNDYKAELSQASLTGPGSSKHHPIQRGSPGGGSENKLSRARGAASMYGRPLQSRITAHAPTVQVFKPTKPKTKLEEKWIAIQKMSSYYRNHIFCVSVYCFVTLGVFAEAFYAVASNNASGLKGIGGYSMATARASAAALMFNFSSILLTMSRNTITQLRETFLHRYIPFDSAITMHRIVAWIALFFTTIHVLAHGINFYSISTQSASDLLCVFSDMWYPSNFLPTFAFWCYQTITGITGVILTLIIIVMYVFAADHARRLIFNWFQWTHKFGYLTLYFFTILHGSGMLISPPRFSYYFLFFATLYTIDRLYSISRKKAEIAVVKAELLPSEVTHLQFKRPNNFDYKAGQWVNIACLAQSSAEYHPFTLSSAPHEEHLSLHIRAVGPWTTNLRRLYDPEVLRDSPYPKLYLDGPFGEGHQDWYRYDVSVLVGGGIGVTPFASILKDLVERTESGVGVKCKAVYFLWVTRDQRQYEWLTDIIREAEEKDHKMILHTHIFITQLPHKFDLRTTMLYICEKHFQKIAGKSLFTGLRAITHFGRPDFVSFLNSLTEEYTGVSSFGVFSCGPPPMTRGVDKACGQLNKYEGATFAHHFENF